MCEVEPSDQMNRCAVSQSIAAIAIPRPIDNATVRFISPGLLECIGKMGINQD